MNDQRIGEDGDFIAELTGCVERLTQERDQAREAARAFWALIEEGCFRDGVECAETDTPEWELWCARHIAEVWAKSSWEWLCGEAE